MIKRWKIKFKMIWQILRTKGLLVLYDSDQVLKGYVITNTPHPDENEYCQMEACFMESFRKAVPEFHLRRGRIDMVRNPDRTGITAKFMSLELMQKTIQGKVRNG